MTSTTLIPASTSDGGVITPSRRLKIAVSLGMPAMTQRFGLLWTRPNLDVVYLAWVRALHATIRATEPLMLEALDQCLRRPTDPVAVALGRYYSRHIKEEFGHDLWLREDYAACGGDPSDFDGLPSRAVTNLVGAQYYLIRHVHPCALLGYIAILEGNPPSTELAPYLAARTGYPEHAFSGLARHAVLDLKHGDEFFKALDGFGLASHEQQAVTHSALITLQAVCDLVDDVLLRTADVPGRGPVDRV